MRSYHTISTLYVSPAGGNRNGFAPENDAHGNGPTTLGAALKFVLELRRSGILQPITIALRGGVYPLPAPIEITPEYGILTIASYGREKAVLSGGTKLEGAVPDSFRGVACISLPVPEGTETNDLFVSGLRADFTRFPRHTELSIKDAENKGSAFNASSGWFEIDPEAVREAGDLTGSIASFFHYWVDEHAPVTSYDAATGRVTLAYPSRYNMMNKTGLFFENLACAFGDPNCWYYDKAASRIYYVPRDDSITPDTAEFVIPRLSRLFNIHGTAEKKVTHFTLRGLTLAHTRSDYVCTTGTMGEGEKKCASDSQGVSNAHASINFEYAENCGLYDCRLTELGVHAVNIDAGCSSITVEGCDIYDCGGGGVKVNGSNAYQPQEGLTHSCVIRQNRILHCGRRHMAACGVLLMNTFNNVVSHNEIGDLYYTGVSAGWVWGYTPSVARDNIIEKNHIHHLGQRMLSDMGGVYLLGSQPGTVVRGNLIHDVYSRDYGGWALYTDEGSGCITLENNVCYDTSDNSYHQHYGRMNTVRNNIFAFSDKELLRISRYEGHLSIIFENNILYSGGAPVYGLSREHIVSGTVGSGRNLLWSKDGGEPVLYRDKDGDLTLDALREYGMEEGSLAADPLFEDADKRDFRLRGDSPAYALGFVPFDWSDVGPCR